MAVNEHSWLGILCSSTREKPPVVSLWECASLFLDGFYDIPTYIDVFVDFKTCKAPFLGALKG